jgi:hypothetical protein
MMWDGVDSSQLGRLTCLFAQCTSPYHQLHPTRVVRRHYAVLCCAVLCYAVLCYILATLYQYFPGRSAARCPSARYAHVYYSSRWADHPPGILIPGR